LCEIDYVGKRFILLKDRGMRLNQIVLLLALGRRIFSNLFRRPTREKKIRWMSIALFSAAFVVADYIFFYRIFRYLDELPLRVGDELIVQLLNVVLLTLFVMAFFSSLIVALSIFYLSRDLEFIHSLPLARGPIVFTRMVRAIFHSAWMVLLFALPLFAAYGYYFQASMGYTVWLAAGLLPFIAIPCLMGIMVIMLLMRYFPTRRAHQVLSFLGLVFLVIFVMYLRFLSPEKFFGQEVSDEMISLFVESLRAPDHAFLPSSWMTVGLTGFIAGDMAQALRQLAWLYATALGLGAALLGLSGRIYLAGWRLVHEVRGEPRSGRNRGGFSGAFARLPLSPVARALLIKDLRTFARDPEQWSQLFILCALVAVYIFNIMNLPLSNVVLKNWVSVLNIGLIGFVLSALISRFVLPAPSMEGKVMWAIYTAPVEMKKYLWGKFWLFIPPLVLIAEVLVVASNYLLQVDAYVMYVSVIGVFLITLSLVGLGLGLGARYPVFNHENVSEIPAGTGGILFMASSLGWVLLVLALGGRPMYLYFNERFLHKASAGIDAVVCYGLIVGLALSLAFFPLRSGVRALEKMDL